MSFATVNNISSPHFDSLLGAAPGGGYPTHFVNTYGNSSSAPGGVPKAYWCQRISVGGKSSSQLVAETLDALGPPSQFGVENGKPALVMWDELSTATGNTIAGAANAMLVDYGPTYLYRWGAYLVNGPNVDYALLSFPLDHLLAGGGRIGVELYPYYVSNGAGESAKNYWSGGSTTTVRDSWLRQFFMGRDPSPSNPVPSAQRVAVNRLAWLKGYQAANWPNSASIIHPIFGVSEHFLNGTQPNRFMDRMFYAFQTSQYGALMSSANDLGVGSWTWAEAATDWDGWFRVMWDYYCLSFSAGKAPRTSAPSAP